MTRPRNETRELPIGPISAATALSVAFWAAESLGTDPDESAPVQAAARAARDAISRLSLLLERRDEYADYERATELGWGGPLDGGDEGEVMP